MLSQTNLHNKIYKPRATQKNLAQILTEMHIQALNMPAEMHM